MAMHLSGRRILWTLRKERDLMWEWDCQGLLDIETAKKSQARPDLE